MAEKEVVVRISADTAEALKTIGELEKQLRSDFKSIEAEAKKMSGGVHDNMKKMEGSASGLKAAWSKLKGAWLEITGAIAAVHFLKQWAMDSIEAEAASNKLKTQIENLGVAYKDVEPAVTKAIKATSQYAIVQEEDVAKTLQDLVFITGDLDTSLSNLNLVYDLAHQKGISVSDAANMIGKAMLGNTDGLSRYFPRLRELIDSLGENATATQRAAIALTFLSETVGGATLNMTEHEKMVRQAHITWNNITQYIGDIAIYVFDGLVKGMKGLQVHVLEAISALTWLTDKLRITSDMHKYMQIAVEETRQELEQLKNYTYGASEATQTLGQESKKAANDIEDITKSIQEQGKAAQLTEKQILEITKKVTKAIDDQGDTSKLTATEKAKASKKINDLIKDEIDLIKKQTKVEKEEIDRRKRLDKELLDARISNHNEALKSLRETLSDGEKRYKEYRDTAISLEKEIKTEGENSEKTLQDMKRRFMPDNLKNIAILKDAEKNLSDARQAFARGDYEAAAGFFRKAQTDYQTLESAVKSKTQVFTGTTQKIFDTAIKGYEEASGGLTTALTEQQKAAITSAIEQKKANTELTTQIDDISSKIETLTKEKKAIELGITVEGYDEAITMKAELAKDTSSTHTVYVKTVQTQSEGGQVLKPLKAATGRHFPGYGGGDKIPILGEAGEYMNRKEAVNFWGVGLFDALNRIDVSTVMASLGAGRFADGGPVRAPSGGDGDKVSVDLLMGNKAFSMSAKKEVASNFVKEIKKTNILRGRYTTPY